MNLVKERNLAIRRMLLLLMCICPSVTHSEVLSFASDSLNRVTNITYSSGGSISYKYDKGGNRILMLVTAPNRPPVVGNDSLGARQNQSVNASAIKLLANDTDPDGDALSISAVSAASTNGATVVLNASLLTYTPVSGFSGEDRFTYTLSDGRGGLATGTVVVNVRSTNAPASNPPSITITENGKRIRFLGIPSQHYVLQSAELVNGPWTNLSGTLTAGPTGIVEYEDNEQPPTTRFYRIIPVP